jgi:hypothetical protein
MSLTTAALEVLLLTPCDTPALEVARLSALQANASGLSALQARAVVHRVLSSDLKGIFLSEFVIPPGYLDAPPATYRRVKEAVVYSDALSIRFNDILAELEGRGLDEAYLALLRLFLADAAPQSRVAGTAALAVATALLRT